MGTWGVAIFSDDLAADVRGEYRDHIGDGLGGPEATDAILAAHAEELADLEAAPVVWLALAATQVRLGRLEDRVRERVIAIVDGGDDLARWQEDQRLLPKRRAVLSSLREQLLGPQPAPVRVPKRRYSEWPFAPGAVVAFRRASGSGCLLLVADGIGDRGGRYGIVEPLDWSGDEWPSPDEIERLRPAVGIDWTAREPHRIGLIAVRGKGLDRFAHVGSTSVPVGPRPATMVTIEELDALLDRRYGL